MFRERNRDYSNISHSTYVTVSNPNVPDEEYEPLIFRISGHEQRPTYYRPIDFEIGTHNDAVSDTVLDRKVLTALVEQGRCESEIVEQVLTEYEKRIRKRRKELPMSCEREDVSPRITSGPWCHGIYKSIILGCLADGTIGLGPVDPPFRQRGDAP